jgi:lysylphosphatidylglycerol synthetase-like protein (DUF2156 family)
MASITCQVALDVRSAAVRDPGDVLLFQHPMTPSTLDNTTSSFLDFQMSRPALQPGGEGVRRELIVMAALLLVLLLVAILFGAGAAVHMLWWVAVIALALWVVGFFARPQGGRWYRW